MEIPWDVIPIGYGDDELNPEAEDLIKKLLNPDYKLRLGSVSVNDIKSHKFFEGNFYFYNKILIFFHYILNINISIVN